MPSRPVASLVRQPLSTATHRSSLDQLTDWAEWADKVVVF